MHSLGYSPRPLHSVCAKNVDKVLSVRAFDTLEEAIEWNNAVPQGLSSALFTTDVKDVGVWTGASGSDCGIVNVNVGTSGAEVGAAFGGNKVCPLCPLIL